MPFDNFKEKIEYHVTRALQELLSMQKGNVCYISPSDVARYIKKKYGYDFSNQLKLISEIIAKNTVMNIGDKTWAVRDEVVYHSPRGSYHLYIYKKKVARVNAPRIVRQIVNKA
ncbi:MAG: hypothetical protein JHC26_10340 [Thermofilum sp.]|uniref:hypothetical protein n=1 Tax=Thermofilum sp. TaxID=1961369 RepID=UPI0025890F9F|nr:hypothetical protein [Thermofilum sp.]MCI4409478.1 hypothetical protein [Thermofilum sp.]